MTELGQIDPVYRLDVVAHVELVTPTQREMDGVVEEGRKTERGKEIETIRTEEERNTERERYGDEEMGETQREKDMETRR